MILGAVLAGGEARRFGSDKAVVDVGGERMIDTVVRALSRQCAAVVICGRNWGDLPSLADRPHGGLGPLGGLAAALTYAQANGYAAVLSAPCDIPDLPNDLADRLSPASAYVEQVPVIGMWSSALAPVLDAHLAGRGRRSMRAWAAVADARAVTLDRPLANINRPEELAAYLAR